MPIETYFHIDSIIGKIYVHTPYYKPFARFMRCAPINGNWDGDVQEWIVEYSKNVRDKILEKMKEYFGFCPPDSDAVVKRIDNETKLHKEKAYTIARKVFPELFNGITPSLVEIERYLDSIEDWTEEEYDLWEEFEEIETLNTLRADQELID